MEQEKGNFEESHRDFQLLLLCAPPPTRMIVMAVYSMYQNTIIIMLKIMMMTVMVMVDLEGDFSLFNEQFMLIFGDMMFYIL